MDSLFKQAFDSLDTPHMCVDRDLCFVAVNRAYEHVVGRTRDELIGRGFFAMFPEDGVAVERLRESLMSVFETGETSTIAFLRYRIPNPKGGFDDRYWTATHTAILDADGRVSHVVQNTMDVTELAHRDRNTHLPFRNVPVELALLRHAQDVEEAYRESASESAEFRRLFRQAPGMVAVLEGKEMMFTFVNDAFQNFFAGRVLLGRPIREAVPEFESQRVLDLLVKVMTEGQQVSGENLKLRVADTDTTELCDAFLDFTFSPLRNDEGEVVGIFFQSADRTGFMQAVERQRHLIDELNHRVKNTLATVQSMARQSFRNVEDATQAREAFESRIMALSQAHNVLSARRWEAASLTEVLDHELSSFDPDRLDVAGSEIQTSAPAAIALAMVFHELASNALQHGAMAHPEGRLKIEWFQNRTRSGRLLAIVWREHCPRAPSAPIADGFGMRMIRRVVTGELGGNLHVELHPDGLECRIEVQISEVEERGSTAA